MTVHVSARPHAGRRLSATGQLRWLGLGLALALAMPLVLADLAALQRDVYTALYAVAVFLFVGAWLRATRPGINVLRGWRWALVLTVAASVVLVAIVLGKDATARPHGWDFVGALLLRGVLYGIADGLLLSVFPILAVYALFGGPPFHGVPLRRVVGMGAAALAASLVFTAVYHAGYGDFRSAKLRQPVAGDVVWSAPTLFTASPLGAPLAHAAMHIAAVIHTSETDLFLPPHRTSLVPLERTSASAALAHVYFLRGEQGEAVHRAVPSRTPATAAVRALLRGPTSVERARGFGSAVPRGTTLLGLTIRGGLATADLSRRFESGGGTASMQARLAQLVYTLTAVETVDGVALRLGGRSVRVFGGEGLILDRPLTRASFPRFLR